MRTNRRGLVAFVACLVVGGSAFGRQAEGPQAPESGAPVVRVSVEVIQVDAVVTDKDGRHVPDLASADFEILEDGRRQDITHCSYVSLEGAPATAPGRPEVARSPQPDPRETIRRTVVIVVDDLSLRFPSMVTARQALARFVDEQMQPGDFVAILQTGTDSGALQPFTSDKRLLRAAIARLRFNLAARGAITPLSIGGSGGNASAPASGGDGSGAGDAALAALRGQMNDFADASQRQRQLYLAMGTMDTLRSVLRGLQPMPGRKSLVFLSEGFVQRDRWGERSDIYERLRAVTDLANRASVVVYAINPAGLEATGPVTSAEFPDASSAASSRMAAEEARGGLETLAEDTGGLLPYETNDISGALGRVLDDQSDYYLIGYKPDESWFKPDKSGPRYHKIQIKVRRPGLRVRSRRGFYAGAGSEARSATQQERLADAFGSPFAARDLGVRLTSLFGSDPKSGPYVRSLLHVDLQGVTFQEQPDGSSQTKLEIAVRTLGMGGFAVERVAQSVTIPEFLEGARRDGVDYTLDVPVKKPGPYQVRAAVRDVASNRLGAASQFVEVPDLGAGRLALSGLTVSGGVDPDSAPAVRRFHPGASVSYALAVYNAHTLSATGHPDLLVRPSLYRDDRLLQSMPTQSFDGAGQPDPKRLALAGSFPLDASMEPGLYVLEVAVQDKAAGPKASPVAQWMDFEVVD